MARVSLTFGTFRVSERSTRYTHARSERLVSCAVPNAVRAFGEDWEAGRVGPPRGEVIDGVIPTDPRENGAAGAAGGLQRAAGSAAPAEARAATCCAICF